MALINKVLPGYVATLWCQDDATPTPLTDSVAGARTGAKITTQNQVTSLAVTAAWNPADTAQLLIRDDGYNGTIVRTYVVAVYDGTDTVAYAFNGMIGGMSWDMSPSAEGKFNFTIHPVGGNSYGWSNNT